MGFCQNHWSRLRVEIDKVGLGVLVSESGEEVAAKTAEQLRSAEVTVDNYDPLMSAYFAILSNGGDMVKSAGGSPLYVMMDGDEDPMGPSLSYYEPKFQLKYSGKTWPRCVICYLNIVHEMTCSGCELPQETGFDWLIGKAAEEEVKRWKELGGNRT